MTEKWKNVIMGSKYPENNLFNFERILANLLPYSGNQLNNDPVRQKQKGCRQLQSKQ